MTLLRRPPLCSAGRGPAGGRPGPGFVPLLFLVDQAGAVGWAVLCASVRRRDASRAHGRAGPRVGEHGSAILGVAAAWCVERTALPGRRVWAVLMVLPIAMPEFVAASGWVSIAPSLEGLPAAVLVMTLALYPLVYLPVAGALARRRPGRWRRARAASVSGLAGVRAGGPAPAAARVLGGSLIVALYLLAEYGTFALVRYTTFTTEIFSEYHGSGRAAAPRRWRSCWWRSAARCWSGSSWREGRPSYARVGRGAPRRHVRRPLGWMAIPVLGGLGALVGLALGVPLGALGTGSSGKLDDSALGVHPRRRGPHVGPTASSRRCSATVLALPVAVLAVRRRGWLATGLERSTYVARALPGLVVGLAFVFFSIRYARPLYQSSAMVVLAYVFGDVPAPGAGGRPGCADPEPAAPRRRSAARWAGRPLAVFWRVTMPLIRPGLAAALALVFLSSVHELTATLLLRPTGAQTLTTQFWVYTSSLAYGAAAPYAALLVLLSAVPPTCWSGASTPWRRWGHGDRTPGHRARQGVRPPRPCCAGSSWRSPDGALAAVLGPVGVRQDHPPARGRRLRVGRRRPCRVGRRAVDDGRRRLRPSGGRSATCPRRARSSRTSAWPPTSGSVSRAGSGAAPRGRAARAHGGLAAWRSGVRTSSRAASSSASPSRAPSPPAPAGAAGRALLGARRRAARGPAGRGPGRSAGRPGPPPCWSPTTRRRPSSMADLVAVMQDGRIVQAAPRACSTRPRAIRTSPGSSGRPTCSAARSRAPSCRRRWDASPSGRRGGCSIAATPSAATVLVRPEQIDVCAGPGAADWPVGSCAATTTVLYVLVTIAPMDDADGNAVVIARVAGTQAFERDTPVTLRAPWVDSGVAVPDRVSYGSRDRVDRAAAGQSGEDAHPWDPGRTS